MSLLQGAGPFEERHRCGSWQVLVRAEQGRRPGFEDTWRVLPDVELGQQHVHVLAVFDGVGGEAHGKEAAQAAAEALPRALQEGPEGVLRALQGPVQATGGSTTALVLALDAEDPRSAVVASVGDSLVFALDPGARVRQLNPKDRLGGAWLSDHLANPELRGHVRPVRLAHGSPLLLCTDGVHDVVHEEDLRDLLLAPEGAREAQLELLFDRIRARGAPDNATLLLVSPDQ